MSKEELLNKLVDAFHYEMDWESEENIDSAMTLCLPIIEEYAQSKVNNSVLDDVNGMCCENPKHATEVNDMFESWTYCKNCDKDIV